MTIEVIAQSAHQVTLQLTIHLQGELLEVEEHIQSVLNEAGCTATALAIAQFDSDGSPILTGGIKWTRRCRSPKTYQTPYGSVEVERDVYQTSQGGKTYIPLESSARIIRSSTPRFAKQVTNKYARMNAGEVCADLSGNHGRQVSRGTVQLLADTVGGIAQLKEESWQYQTPTLGGCPRTSRFQRHERIGDAFLFFRERTESHFLTITAAKQPFIQAFLPCSPLYAP